MKKVFFALMLGLAALAVSCTPEYDDTDLKNRMDQIEQDVDNFDAALESLLGRIAAAEKAVEDLQKALADADYVVSVVASEDGKGVVVTFKNADPIFIPLDLDAEEVDGVVIADVKVEGETATFTFTDGSTVEMPLYHEKAFSLNLDATKITVTAGATVKVGYTVTEATEETVVDVLATTAGYVAKVTETEIEITIPDPFVNGEVLVWADNGAGKSSIRKIGFEESSITVEEVAEVPAEGGEVVIKGVSNVEVAAEVVEGADWLTAAPAGKAEFSFSFTAAANEGAARTAKVALKNGETVVYTVTVAQAAAAKDKELKRVWGKYSTDTFWYTFDVDAQWLSQELDRGMAMDDENLYVAKCTAYASRIVAFPMNGEKSFDINTTGLASNGANHYSVGASLNVIKNGEDFILLAANLKNTSNLEIWAWIDGVDAAPTKIVDYVGTHVNGAADITADWRRYGDRMTIVGDWNEGQIWLASWNPSKTLVYSINNGVASEYPKEHMIDPTDNIKEVVVYPGVTDEVFVTANGIGKFYKDSGTANGNGWELWNAGEDYSNDFGLTYSYEFFEMNNKKYIAYVKVEGVLAPKARLVVIEDGDGTIEGFKKALTDHVVAWEFPLQSESDFSFEAYKQEGVAGNSLGSCVFIESNGEAYIGAHAQAIGLSFFKFE